MAARPIAVLLGDIEANIGIGEVLLDVEGKNEGGAIVEIVAAPSPAVDDVVPSIIDAVGLVVVGT